MYDEFYVGGKKIIPKLVLKKFSIETLLYLICDDGYVRNGRIGIATDCFKLHELQILAIAINKLNVNCEIHIIVEENKFHYRLSLDRNLFYNHIKCLNICIPLAMEYKFNSTITEADTSVLNQMKLINIKYQYTTMATNLERGKKPLKCMICDEIFSANYTVCCD